MKYDSSYSLFLLLSALIVSFTLTGLMITVSKKLGFINNPNPLIKSHKIPVPYGGGIAIGLTLILIIFFSNPAMNGIKFCIWIVPVLLAGLIDDILKLSPLKKMMIEILSLLPFYLYLSPPYYYIIIYLLFLLSVQNAWNLVDIMDGLTAGISILTFLTFGIITSLDKRLEFYTFLSFSVVFSTLGFWVWNKHPAKIFLGDTGSLLLGSIFGFMVFGVFLMSEIKAGFLILLGGIPFFEMCFLIIIRIKKGIPFYKGSPDHFALRMLESGNSVQKINKQFIIISALHSLFVLVLSNFGPPFINLIIAYIVTITGAVIAYHYFKNIPTQLITS
jgi:UDP-GlcNAc:undecaprenyl-phosphate GlcNAc-1-phosphate transferase